MNFRIEFDLNVLIRIEMRNVYDGIVEAHVQIYYSVSFIKHVSQYVVVFEMEQ